MDRTKKNIFFLISKKMNFITKETDENNNIEVIVDDNDTLWFNEKHIEETLCNIDSIIITSRYDPIYKRYKYKQKNQKSSGIFLHDKTHSNVLSYRIDLYFHDYKLAIQTDEDEHNARNIDQKIQIQKAIEKGLCCQFIRINPNDKGFNIFEFINKINILKNQPKIY